ncbi:TatD family hydrolase [Geofilum sp. OHC36d9]|uniref:TatD family hydrolase n=1 Tax=Geofilum sp. OHC36d9 TaxID=3458413 RepID=UPI00403349E0
MTIIDFHTHKNVHPETVLAIQSIRQGEPLPQQGFFGYGVHPWDSKTQNKLKFNSQITTNKNLFYIGECGLDKLKGSSLEQQISIFEEHIQISEKLKKPLVIHCVGYFNELLQIKKEKQPIQPWIIHGFTGHPQLARQLTSAGFRLSFGPAILIEKSKAAQSLKQTPPQSFFLETDDSNEPIQEIYKNAARIHATDIKQLIEIIWNNFISLSI